MDLGWHGVLAPEPIHLKTREGVSYVIPLTLNVLSSNTKIDSEGSGDRQDP